VCALLGWAAGVLPVVVLRKTLVGAAPAPAVSPGAALKHALRAPGARRAAVVYAGSALALVPLHLFAYHPGAHIGIFGGSRYAFRPAFG
jgi:hypothetical protein